MIPLPMSGTRWRHRNGNMYRVLFWTNEETSNQDRYPTTIVYENEDNRKKYSRKLVDWNSDSFTHVDSAHHG